MFVVHIKQHKEMNIKVILLSIYLYFTLEITKISGLIIETQFLNAISNIDTIITMQGFIQDKTERAFYLLDALRDEAVKISLGLSHQVNK